MEQVAQRIHGYSLLQVTDVVGRITLALATIRNGTDNVPIQRHIAAGLVGEDAAAELIDAARRTQTHEERPDEFVLFHERQLLNALKIALLIVNNNDPGPNFQSFGLLVEALLMLNDLIDPDEGTMGPAMPGGAAAMELYLSANSVFNESPAPLHEFVRAHFLYVEAHPELRLEGLVDVPAMLSRATGMPAETAWRALFALFVFWSGRDMPDIDAGRVAVRKGQYLETMPKLSIVERDNWFELATWALSSLQERIRRDYALDDPRYWDVLPFEERPLIAFGDVLYCASVPLLLRLAGGSLQHRLQDKAVFTKEESRGFRDTRGHLVELYTFELLRRIFGDRLVTESQLQEFSDGASVCDGIIVYPDALILVECKTASPLLDTRHAANYASYRGQWGRTIRKAGKQFESTIALLQSGRFTQLGLDPAVQRELYPVIGVFELPVHPLTYRTVMQVDMQGQAIVTRMRSGEVRPLQLLNIKDIELWELAAEDGLNILNLLREKTSSPEWNELSFQHFTHFKGIKFKKKHSAWQAERFNEISGSAQSYFRDLGLLEADDSAT